jgi:hypothetical protein
VTDREVPIDDDVGPRPHGRDERVLDGQDVVHDRSLFYRSLLGGNPENVIRLAGALLLCAAVAVLFVSLAPRGRDNTGTAS